MGGGVEGVGGGAHLPTQGPLAVLTARVEPRLRDQHRETGGRRRTERGGWRGVVGGKGWWGWGWSAPPYTRSTRCFHCSG